MLNGRRIFIWLKRIILNDENKIPKTIKAVTTLENPNTQSPKLHKKDIDYQRTSSIFTVSGTEYDQKTVSTPVSRHPAEDTADFVYDNKALELTVSSQ